jgi:uncharacterized membrane protein YbhN (UPF0104 family)
VAATAVWRRRLLVLGSVLGLLLFARQVWVSLRAIEQQDLVQIKPYWLLASLAGGVLVFAFQLLAWAQVMRYLGVSIPLRQLLRGFYLSFVPRYIPGSVWGYWSRSEWLEQDLGVPYGVSLTGSVLEALAAVLTGVFVALLHLASGAAGPVRVILILSCGTLLALTILAVPRLATGLGRRLLREKAPSTIGRHHSLPLWSVAILFYLVLWAAFGASLHCSVLAIAGATPTGLLTSMFAASVSWIVGFLAVIIPAGLGVREVTLSALLASASGLPSWQADVIATVSRFVLILAELLWLVAGIVLSARRWRCHRGHGETETAPSQE